MSRWGVGQRQDALFQLIISIIFLNKRIEDHFGPSCCLTYSLQTPHLHQNPLWRTELRRPGEWYDELARREMQTARIVPGETRLSSLAKETLWVTGNSRQHTPRWVVNNILRFQFSNASSLLSLFYRIIPDMVNVKPCLLHEIPVYLLLNSS